MKRRIRAFLLSIAILLGMVMPGEQVWAATGSTSISVSAGTLNIGESVTVSVSAKSEAGNNAVATMTLNYDASILEFVSCSASVYGGGNGSVTVSTDSFSVTLKAKSAGTSALAVSATDGVDFVTTEELTSMSGSSSSITVNNAAAGGNTGGGSTGGSSSNNGGSTGGESTGGSSNAGGESTGGNSNTGGATVKLSADNSLKSLTISPGTLSPEFKGSRVNYTATVSNDVTTIAVNAVVSNNKATVESLTGNTNLKVGENVIKIVVKAENGTTATYAIKVTREAEGEAVVPPSSETVEPSAGEGNVSFKNASYVISESISASSIPADFEKTTANYHGTEYPAAVFTNGSITMFYLLKAENSNTGEFAIYDETRDTFYPYVRIANGDNYVIPLMSPVDATVPDDYTNTSFSTKNGESVTAYQRLSDDEMAKDFYLFYGVNQDGEENWYQYDAFEHTYQRAYQAFETEESAIQSEAYEYLSQQYSKLKTESAQKITKYRNIMYVMIFVAVLLVILLLNLLLFNRKGGGERYEEDVEEDDIYLPLQPEKEAKKAPTKEKKKEISREIEVFDFNDED